MNDAAHSVAAAWREGLGLALLVGIAFAIAPWIIHGLPIAIVAAASCGAGVLVSIAVARWLHGRRFALRYAIASAGALVGGGVALYLVELPAALFVAVLAAVFVLLGLIFYRAEDVARRDRGG